MFSVTHFRTEFVRRSEATILRRVTMTQFMLVIIMLALGVGVFGLSYWLAPVWMALGYLAGYVYRGELLLKRGLAYAVVWLRQVAGAPRLANIEAAWAPAPVARTPTTTTAPVAAQAYRPVAALPVEG